jgi:hypothetical protein
MGRKTRTESRSSLGLALRGPTLRALADLLPLVFLLTDPVGVPLLASARFRDRLGGAPEAGWLALVEASDRPAAEALWLAAAVERAPREAELRVRTPLGAAVLCCRVAPVEEDGRLVGWLVAFAEKGREAIEEARAAEALAEARRGEADDLRAVGEAARRDVEARLAVAKRRLREAEAARRQRESEARRVSAEARAAQALRRLSEAEERGRRAAEAAGASAGAAPDMLWTARTDEDHGLHGRAIGRETGAGVTEDCLGPVHPEDRERDRGLWGEAGDAGQPFGADNRLGRRQGDDGPVPARAQPVRNDGAALLDRPGGGTDQGTPIAGPGALAETPEARERTGSELAQAHAETLVRPGAPPDPSRPVEGPSAAPEADRRPLAGAREVAESGFAAPDGPDGAGLLARVAPVQGHEAELDRLAGRLRSETLRDGLARWRAARSGAALPRFEGWEVEVPGVTGQVEAEIDRHGAPVRLRWIRPAPESQLLRAVFPEARVAGVGWSRVSALRRPVHDYACVKLGPEGSRSFERLILPFSAEGDRVDRAVLLLVAEQAGGAP